MRKEWKALCLNLTECRRDKPQEQIQVLDATCSEYISPNNCSRLFKLEDAFAKLMPEERYEKRLEQEKPVLDGLLS